MPVKSRTGQRADGMNNWTTTQSRKAVEWALNREGMGKSLNEVASELERTPEALKEFLRRVLPREQWPWQRKPRWDRCESAKIEQGLNPNRRSKAAIRKRNQRVRKAELENEHEPLTVTQVAQDIGRSRTTVHRMVKDGLLRRFKRGIAESSFEALLREHPERIPYERLPRTKKEWLVLNGFRDETISVRVPSVRGLLE